MDKRKLVEQVIANLVEQAERSEKSSAAARQASIDAPGAMQSHSDTTRAQQGWLSDSLARMGTKTQRNIRNILQVDLSPSDQVRLGSIATVRNEKSGIRTSYLILPGAAGTIVQTEDNQRVVVVSPEAPMAKGILTRRMGERCAVPAPSGTQFFIIESIA